MKRAMKTKISILMILVVLVLTFSACGTIKNKTKQEEMLYAIDVKEAPVSANPQQAIDSIYEDHAYIADEMTENYLAKTTNVSLSDVIEVYGKLSDAKGTLADIIIVKPLPGARDAVREQLYVYKEKRINEFENYDILDAHAIAKDAVVYDQGEYLVLLMLEDNSLAQGIVDEYIPQ